MLWGWIPSWHPAGFSEEMFGKCWMSPALDRKPMAKARKEETEGNLRRWVSGKPRAGPGEAPSWSGGSRELVRGPGLRAQERPSQHQSDPQVQEGLCGSLPACP